MTNEWHLPTKDDLQTPLITGQSMVIYVSKVVQVVERFRLLMVDPPVVPFPFDQEQCFFLLFPQGKEKFDFHPHIFFALRANPPPPKNSRHLPLLSLIFSIFTTEL